MQVERRESAEALAEAVAERFGELVNDTPVQAPHVVLTGGTIADLIHRRVAALPMDLSGVAWWWGDDRWVPADSGDRNARQAEEVLLSPRAIAAERQHRFPPSDAGLTLDQAAVVAAAALAENLGSAPFDLVMLSLGPDGHIASLFPDHPELAATGSVVAVRDSPKPPSERLSLTLPRLLDSRQVWLFVSGEPKRDALNALLAPTGSPRTSPARPLLPHPHLTLWTDLPR